MEEMHCVQIYGYNTVHRIWMRRLHDEESETWRAYEAEMRTAAQCLISFVRPAFFLRRAAFFAPTCLRGQSKFKARQASH
jgi:hypothetical protein